MLRSGPCAWALCLGVVPPRRRVVMAPLTRVYALRPGDVPHALNATYHGRRAGRGGLIIAEAAGVSVQAGGHPGASGFYSDGHGAGAGSWTPCAPRAA